MGYTLKDVLFVVDVILVTAIVGSLVAQLICLVTRWIWNRKE